MDSVGETMNRLMAILMVVLAGLLACGCSGEGTRGSEGRPSAEAAPIPMTLVGTRDFSVGETRLRIPWYRLDADYQATSTADFWKNVEAPAGTKTTYVGHYGEVRWCKWLDDKSHEIMRAKGLLFMVPDEYRVTPGPGAVRIRWWLYEEQTPSDATAFRDGRYYVFCLDRQPVKQWINLAEEPSCDMDSELPHVIAIMEIHPTFDFGPRPSSPALYLTRDSLLAYCEERYGNLSSSYKLEYAVTRKEDGSFELQTPQGRRAAKPEVVQKLLYALNTCTWQPQQRPHRFEDPAVTRTLIAYLDDQGAHKTVIIEYDGGGWHLQYPEKKYYSTIFPYLLYEVENDIVTACSQDSRDKVSDKPEAGNGR
jgi:hypothetical protein